MNTKDTGDLAESATITEPIRANYSVSIPFGDNDPYDLVIEKEGEAELVQVKAGWIKNGKVVFNCYKNTTKDGEYYQETYESSEIDKFAVWCEERKELYLIPVEETPSAKMSLRFEEAEIQNPNINNADDYLVKLEETGSSNLSQPIMNAEDLVRADTWWRLRQKLKEDLLGEKTETDFGFNTDT